MKISVLVPILIETNHKNANAKFEEMPALQGKDYGKSRTQYPDFVQLDSGLQFKDLKTGDGQSASNGKEVVVDWSGVTLGYYGRPFEARNKPVGGAFVGDTKDFFRFTVGDENIIPAFNEAVSTMKVGGIRRIIVPPEIGYPAGNFKKFGPKPTTFSGERTLDFVLKYVSYAFIHVLTSVRMLSLSPCIAGIGE